MCRNFYGHAYNKSGEDFVSGHDQVMFNHEKFRTKNFCPFSGVIISNNTYKYYVRKGEGPTPWDQAPKPEDAVEDNEFPGYKHKFITLYS